MHERDVTVSKSSLAKTEGDLIGNLKHDAYIYTGLQGRHEVSNTEQKLLILGFR
jgi:hypothetical protein